MKKRLHVLNTEFIINAKKEVIDFVIEGIPDIKDNLLLRSYAISYIEDEHEYEQVNKKLTNKKTILFYGEDEIKEKQIVGDKVFLVDKNSIIINNKGNFTIIGKNEKARRTLIYLIREAIYENYILNKDLVLHSAAVELDDKGYSLVGYGGAGKTTLLMELIDKLDANYITNDILVINNDDELIPSILPLRIANGSMSRFSNESFTDLKEKSKYEIDQFTKLFDCKLKSRVPLDKILLPHYSMGERLEIDEASPYDAFDTIIGQTMNINDPVRPYMWVNEFEKSDVLKTFDINERVSNLVDNHQTLSVVYGDSINEKEKDKILRLLK